MQQQLADGLGLVVLEISKGVLVDVRVVKKGLTVLDMREGVGDLSLAGPQSLDLGAVKYNARLERFEDVVIAAGLRVGEDVGHKRKPPGRPNSGCDSPAARKA